MATTTARGPSVTLATGIPDGMRCIICRQSARGGTIVHRAGCPDYQPVRRQPCGSAGPDKPEGHTREVGAQERFERFVALLGPERRRDRYDCPSCGGSGRSGRGMLVTLDAGRIRFHCFSCRGTDEILRAMGVTWEWVTG